MLGVNLLIDLVMEKVFGSGFECVIIVLYYGLIVINGWIVFGFIMLILIWGVFFGGMI